MNDPVTVRMVERARNPGHVRVAVYVGRTFGSRGHSGDLTLRTDEWDELVDLFTIEHDSPEDQALGFIANEGLDGLRAAGVPDEDAALLDRASCVFNRVELLREDPWDSPGASRLQRAIAGLEDLPNQSKRVGDPILDEVEGSRSPGVREDQY